MVTILYSIKDKLSEYSSPIPFYDERQAVRYFIDQCTGGNQWITRNKEDFSLVRLGTMDTETGNINNEGFQEVMKGEEINGKRNDTL